MEQALIIATLLAKYGPGLAQAVVEIFQKPNPTLADWDAVFALAEKNYADYVKPNPLAKPNP